jgi:hypothetical protein
LQCMHAAQGRVCVLVTGFERYSSSIPHLRHHKTGLWRQMLQLARSAILEAAFSVADIRGLFAVAVDAILRLLGTFPK